jgi:nitrate/TMAO reductase-like tetraheme cytochrome c subunit
VTKLERLVRHPLSIVGALVATTAAVVFIALVIASLAGMFDNPYAGLVVFVAIPALFLVGLLLVPAGMWLEERKLQRHPEAAAGWPVLDFREPRVRRGALLITALTAANLVILLLAGYGSLHWMESPTFCGQVCHTPMHPQFTAWNNGPHARIACVRCHVGEGTAAVVHAKMSGVRQLIEVSTNSFPRPIPPGAKMPAGAQAETCRGCHQPERAVGDRVIAIREYADDESNSETTTVLQMFLGRASSRQQAIHWHADPAVRVEYVSTDAARETIPYVRVTNADGSVKEYVTKDVTDQAINAGTRRTMDCMDCHNTVGHPISPTPERAVDTAMAAGLISRQLPYARREGVRVLKASYDSEDAALRGIADGFRNFYQSGHGNADPQAIPRAVETLQNLYRRNVFPTMKVTWGTYPDNRGHVTSTGCLRCHDGSHTAKDGSTIRDDCESCHKQVETP